jgi:transcriptional regulator with XRE-family HTH domain
MKLKVGEKLYAIRDKKNKNQAEMAELLGLSISAYQRVERNETFVTYEQLLSFAKTLEVPIQEFLPDTITLNNTNNQNGQGGMILGNIYNNYNYSDKEMESEMKLKDKEIEFLKEKISLLETSLTDLRNTVALLQKEK